MRDILSIGLWLMLTGTAITMAVFVAQTLFSKQPVSIGSPPYHSLGSLVYSASVITGWLVFVGMGVYGLLAWLPHSTDDFRGMLTVVAAFFSLSVLGRLERATFVQQDFEVTHAALTWIDYHLHYSSRLTEEEIERLKEESRDQNKTGTELQIARWILALAKELKERDERTETQIIQRLRREREEAAEREHS